MAVAYDAVGPSSSGTTTTSGTAISWTHTAGTGGTAALVFVAVNDQGVAFSSLTASATYGGTSMTLLGKVNSGATTFPNSGGIWVFGITGASTGANTVSVSVSSGGTAYGLEGGSISFTGATTFGTAVTATTGVDTTTSGSVSLTGTSSSNLVACGVANGSGTVNVASPGTRRFYAPLNSNSGAGDLGAGTTPSSAGTVTFSWTQAADIYGAVIVEVQASVAVSDSDASGAGADAGESIAATLSDSDGSNAIDAGESLAVTLSDSEASHETDGGEALAIQSFDMALAMPSQAWLTRWRHQRAPRQFPLAMPSAYLDQDFSNPAADGAEFIVDLTQFTGSSTVMVPPSWKAAYRHTARPAVPAVFPAQYMTVTAMLTNPGFTDFQGGSVLQVYVLDNATQFGGATDAEAIANNVGTGTITPAASGSFIGWTVFNDSEIVTADTVVSNNTFDVNIPGAVAPVGAAGHYTGTVTAGTPLSYGLSNGTTGDEFVLAAVEVPPLNPGVPVAIDTVTPPGVSDNLFATSLTSAAFALVPGTVLVAVYGANNGGTAEECTFAISDSHGLAWSLAAVMNSGGNFLAAIWTATVPTFSVADTDASGPGNDFVSAAVNTGQATVPDHVHGTDAGELVNATVTAADASASTETAVIGIVPVSGDASGAGNDVDNETVTVLGSDASTSAEASKVTVLGTETSGPELDAGEHVTAAVTDTETSTGTDTAFIGVASTDAGGAGADGGETLVIQDFTRQYLPASPSFRARYRHTSRPVMVPFDVTVIFLSDTDAAHGQDAEIDNPFPVDTAETGHGTDAAETVFQSDSDAVRATDITFEFDFAHGTDLELTAWPSDTDGSLAFDPELDQFTETDTDASHAAVDAGEALVKNVPIADSDASHAAADSGGPPNATLGTADASSSVDDREVIPKDTDAGRGTDGEEVASGLFTDTDGSLAFDVESRVFGPNAQVTDSDASGVTVDGGELPDVYAYVPLFRWTGGFFSAPLREEDG